jgi:pyruvate-formate lyase-activating enzyme
VALANKMARTAWALMVHGGTYRAPEMKRKFASAVDAVAHDLKHADLACHRRLS